MGLDAVLYVRAEEEQPGAALDLDQCLGSPLGIGHVDGYVTYCGLERYFSEIYPRGNWPMIRAGIMMLGYWYPGAEIRYGSDHDHGVEEARVVHHALLSEMDLVWAGMRFDKE